jgi:hypothetical protein
MARVSAGEKVSNSVVTTSGNAIRPPQSPPYMAAD